MWNLVRERVAAPLAPGGCCDWGWWRQQPGGQGYRSWRLRICHRLPGHSCHSMVWSRTCETCLGILMDSGDFQEISGVLDFGVNTGSTGAVELWFVSVDQIPGQERMKIPEQKMDYYKDLKIPGWCSGKSPALDSCSSMVWQFNHIQTTIFGRDSPAMFRWAAARRGPRCTWARTGQVIGNGEKWFQRPGEPTVL